MNESDLLRAADFMSIALEEMEKENYDLAQGFVEDALEIQMEQLDN